MPDRGDAGRRGAVRRNVVRGQRVDPTKLARAKELRREMTGEERVLWGCVRGDRLARFHFRRQQVIDGFIADFYCHEAGLVVEVDGPVHDGQAEYDAERDEIMRARGLRMLRLTNREVRSDLPNVLRRIEQACSEGRGRDK